MLSNERERVVVAQSTLTDRRERESRSTLTLHKMVITSIKFHWHFTSHWWSLVFHLITWTPTKELPPFSSSASLFILFLRRWSVHSSSIYASVFALEIMPVLLSIVCSAILIELYACTSNRFELYACTSNRFELNACTSSRFELYTCAITRFELYACASSLLFYYLRFLLLSLVLS